MKLKDTMTLLTLLVLGLSMVRAQEYKENAIKFCTGTDFSTWVLTDEERTKKRASSGSFLSVDFGAVANFVATQDIGSLISGGIMFIIIGAIILFAALASMIVYMLFCCYWDKYESSTDKKIKIFCAVSSVVLVLFIVCVIVTFITVIQIGSSYSEANCALAKLPNDILEGIETENANFIGLRNLKQMLVFFKSEINSLSGLTENFNEIVKKTLPDNMLQADTVLGQFYNTYKDSVVTDGENKKEKPETVTAMTNKVNTAIEAEFAEYNTVATKLNDAALNGKNYITPSTTTDTVAAIDQANTYLDVVIVGFEKTFNEFSKFAASPENYVNIGRTSILVISSFIVLFSLIMILILYCQCQKERCFGMNCPFKCCLVTSGFLTVLLSAVTIVVMIFSVGISGFCEFTSDILEADDVSSVLSSFGETFSADEISMLNNCLKKEGDAQLTDLLGSSSESISGMEKLLDGLTAFQNFKPTLSTNGLDSLAIIAQTEVWNKYKLGIFIDHANVLTTLDELNKLIECKKEQFRISATNCTTTQEYTCKSIAGTQEYTPPICSDDENLAFEKYKTLRTYYVEENALMERMMLGLSNAEEDTANARFRTAKQNMIDSFTLFDGIANSLSGTINQVTQFGESFSEGANCNILRTEFENVESAMCFSFNSDLFYAFLYLILASISALATNWLICVTFRCITEEEENEYDDFDDTEASGIEDREKK